MILGMETNVARAVGYTLLLIITGIWFLSIWRSGLNGIREALLWLFGSLGVWWLWCAIAATIAHYNLFVGNYNIVPESMVIVGFFMSLYKVKTHGGRQEDSIGRVSDDTM